ncbi:MAG TPA: TrkH family potassium uptake protein [Bacteroidales bacterium]|nr:TrkH family potassium uptake protein [Bacteroidales bacterium]
MFSWATIIRIVGINLIVIAVFLLLSIIVAWIYGEAWAYLFFSSLIVALIASFLLYISRNVPDRKMMGKKDAYLTVTFSWVSMGLAGSLPYILSGSIDGPVNAVFESLSGFTTTGSSILTDIESLPKALLFWRSLTHWIGGIGIVLLVVVILPSLKIGGYHLFSSESSFHERIQPRIRKVGLTLVIIYASLTFLEVVFLVLGGMNLFESLCHAFGTVATGGFSPKNDSIAGYSPYLQYVIMLFMFLSGTNYIIHYYLATGVPKKIFSNSEFWFYLKVVLGVGGVLTLLLFYQTDRGLEQSFRDAMFQTVSIITCTGFATDDYLVWPVYAWYLIFLCMFLGGSTGSTAGGIKMVRHLVFLRSLRAYFKRVLHPQGYVMVKVNDNVLGVESQNYMLNFIVTYLFIFAVGTMSLVFFGNDGLTSAGSVATCMAGIGPGLGTTGPVSNFAHLSDISKLTLMLLMLLGRLEFYTILALMRPGFWKP